MDLAAPADGETSATVAARVATARAAQIERATDLMQDRSASKETGFASGPACTNANLPDSILEKVARPDSDGANLLVRAAESLNLTARAYTRTLRVSRTLADLEGSTAVLRRHIAEAISYRRREESAFGGEFKAAISS